MIDPNNLAELPNGWITTSLNNLCSITTGNKDVNAENSSGEYPFFTCAREIHRIDNYSFSGESILIAGNGFFNVKYYNGKFDAYQRTYVLQNININGRYLFYWILAYLDIITQGNRGTTIRYIRLGDLTNHVVLVPPLPEQLRVVNKIEELFTRLDAGVEALKKIQVQLKRYRQSVFKAAFEGQLTAAWREAHKTQLESASVLLERIKTERKNKLGSKYKELPPLDTSELPELPEGWEWTTFDHLVESSQNGISKRGGDSGLLTHVLRLSDIFNGKIDTKSPRDIRLTQDEIVKYRLYPDDYLCIRVNGSTNLVGKMIIVGEESDTWTFCDHFIRFRVFKDFVITNYLYYAFDTESSRNHVKFNMVSSAGQNTVSQPTMLSTFIPFPPLQEQNIIVQEIERLFSIADEIETIVERSIKESERLRQSILKQAFEGKLVAQDPRDEPAEKLLERIKAEKAKTAKLSLK